MCSALVIRAWPKISWAITFKSTSDRWSCRLITTSSNSFTFAMKRKDQPSNLFRSTDVIASNFLFLVIQQQRYGLKLLLRQIYHSINPGKILILVPKPSRHDLQHCRIFTTIVTNGLIQFLNSFNFTGDKPQFGRFSLKTFQHHCCDRCGWVRAQ